MEKNCLVTNYKGVVNNDTLLKNGMITLVVPSGTVANSIYLKVRSALNTKSAIESKYNNLNYNGVNRDHKQDTFSNTDVYIRKPTADKEVFYIEKKNIELFENRFTSPDFDISQLEYASNLVEMQTRGSKGSFSKLLTLPLNKIMVYSHQDKPLFSDISNITTLQELHIYNCEKSSGYLSELGKLTNITKLIVRSTINRSTVESFVAAQVRAGRTTASISFKCFYIEGGICLCTFNGIELEDVELPLSWVPNATSGRTDVTYNGVTITIDNITGNIVS